MPACLLLWHVSGQQPAGQHPYLPVCYNDMSQASNQQTSTHACLSDNVTCLMPATSSLDLTNFLVSQKYAKAQDHQEEVADLVEVLDKC